MAKKKIDWNAYFDMLEIDNLLNTLAYENNIKYSKNKDVILVVGEVGSGKTTLTQFIAGNDNNLISEAVASDPNTFVITDHDKKIGNSTLRSHTTIPNVLEDDEENVAFYDCPGYNKVNDVHLDIALQYFIKSIIESANSVKLVFTIDYSHFYDVESLLLRVASLIKNLDKFKNSVALVVTKVDNKYIEKSGKSVLASDSTIIKDIVEYLNKIKETRGWFNKTLSNFVDILVSEKDEHNNYKRIGIFRKPSESGVLSGTALLQSNKKELKTMLHENIKFTVPSKSDFGYTLGHSPDRVKKYVDGLIKKIDGHLVSDLKSIGGEIKNYFYNQEEKIYDIKVLYDKTQSWDECISARQAAVSKCADLLCTTQGITKILIDHNIDSSNKYFFKIKNHLKYLDFVDTLSNDRVKFGFSEWLNELLASIHTYLDDSKKWYKFLIYFHDVLSRYDLQKTVDTTNNLNQIDYEQSEKNSIIESNFEHVIKNISAKLLDDIKKNDLYKDIVNKKLDEVKLKFLNEVLNQTLMNHTKSFCANNTLTIKGYNVKLSSVFDENCSNVKVIGIFALNKVFIDTNLDKTGEEVKLFIIAPTWEIVKDSKIILNGKSGEEHDSKKAFDGKGIGTNGRNGKPGKPGGPAGSFIGIGENVINGENLFISAKGGKGGPGQDGGYGRKGKEEVIHIPKDGSKASWFDDYCEVEYTENLPYMGHSVVKLSETGTCHVYSMNCTNSGNGGDGGIGGKGGNHGDVILYLPKEESKIVIDNAQGEQGIDGIGGNGMTKAKAGQYLKIGFEIKYKNLLSSEYLYKIDDQATKNFAECLPGINGVAGKNSENLIDPTTTATIHTPTIINNYKNYLRENLKSGVMESSLKKFLDKLDTIDLYDTLGFVNELYGLEEQFHKLRKQLPISPFYESLLNRVKHYAEKIHADGTLTEDKRKVLNYVCTAILTKICSINNHANNGISRNLAQYLTRAINDDKEMTDLLDVSLKNDYQNYYKEQVDEKIKEAEKFERQITPELDNILTEVDNNIAKLIDETITMQKASIKDKNDLKRQKERLESVLVMRTGLGVAKILSTFLAFLGPAGAGASAVISGGITIGESLLLDSISGLKANKLFTLPTGVKTSLTRVKDTLKGKQQLLKEQLEDSLKIIDRESKNEPKDEFVELKKKLANTITELKKEMQDEGSLSAESIVKLRKMREEAVQAIRNKRSEMEKTDKVDTEVTIPDKKAALKEDKDKKDKIINNRLKMLDRVNNIVGIAETSINYYKQIKEHKEKIDELAEAMKSADSKIKNLLDYEEKIYQTIIPICAEIESSLNKAKNSLNDKSQVALDVTAWQVESVLKKVQSQLKELTGEFSVQEALVDNITKLQDSMNLMIDVYKHIQDYKDKKELIDFTANINLNKARSIVIHDKELNDAIIDLKLIIKSNLILEKYEISMDAFKQYVFPFAGVYLAQYHDVPYLLKPNDTEGITKEVGEVIKRMDEKLSDHKNGNTKYSSMIYPDVAFGCESQWVPPFFVWKHHEYKREINNLLEGKEVILKSDIRKGFNQNGIKFNNIGIRFKLANRLLQSHFDQESEHYKVTMKHLGLSSYRCDDRIYTISSNNTDIISYVSRKNCRKNPEVANLNYHLFGSSQSVLSPYGLWSIKLTNIHNTSYTLAAYENQEIDLELEGIGEFLDLGLDVCNDDLASSYTLDDSTSPVNYVGYKNLKNSDEISHETLDALLKSKRYNRVRRSIKDDVRDIHENPFVTNSGYSSMKSSYINTIVSSIGSSLMIFKNWMPKTDLLQWFDYDKETNNQESYQDLNSHFYADMKFLNGQSELPEISNQFADGESARIDSVLSNSSFCTNDNLILLDLLVRRKSGIRYKKSNVTVSSSEEYAQYAQNLAYRGYANDDD